MSTRVEYAAPQENRQTVRKRDDCSERSQSRDRTAGDRQRSWCEWIWKKHTASDHQRIGGADDRRTVLAGTADRRTASRHRLHFSRTSVDALADRDRKRSTWAWTYPTGKRASSALTSSPEGIRK